MRPGVLSRYGHTIDPQAFDPTDPAFLENPYPALDALRETAPVFRHERLRRWFVSRHGDVRACLRDRRLGRNFRHVGTDAEFGAEPLDPRWQQFWASERWSLLWLEPPDHTRIRKLVAAAFTPRNVERLREPAATLAAELLAPQLERGSLDLLRDYAQPYSIALICRLLGVPLDRQRDLLDWSHAMVKMYELDTSDAQADAADRAAAAFRGYVLELIAERRLSPRDDMIGALAEARVDGGRLSDDEIVSTVIVLLNAGHEATVNTLGNGIRALAHHPGQWQALVDGEVDAAPAIEELIRWDPPLQLFERWVLDDGVEVAGVPCRAARGSLSSSARRIATLGCSPSPADSTWPVRTPPPTSASAAASTCASAPRSRVSSWRPACRRWSTPPPASSSSPSRGGCRRS